MENLFHNREPFIYHQYFLNAILIDNGIDIVNFESIDEF